MTEQSGDSSEPVAGASVLAARMGLVAGPILALLVFWLLPHEVAGGLSFAGRACAGIATLMAVWWMTEALPLEATALLPLILLPLADLYPVAIMAGDVVQVRGLNAPGVVASVEGKHAVVAIEGDGRIISERYPLTGLVKEKPFGRAAAAFADPSIFLFLGGFMIALAIERWGLHRRMALLIVLGVGTRPSQLIGGFMIATGLISMWISNTATTVMMLPIGLSVVQLLKSRLSDKAGPSPGTAVRDANNFGTCLLLGLAYASSLGGFATIVGTPPNVYFAGYMRDRGVGIDFGRWMLFATPLSIGYLALAWWLMTKVLFPVRLKEIPGGRELIREEYRKLGPVSRGEWIVLTVFLLTATLWIVREPLTKWPPATQFFPALRSIDDSLIAMAGAIVLFAIPVYPRQGIFALDWKTAVKLPWGVLLLFGGGLSLAAAMTDSGLAKWIGLQVTVLAGLPTLWQIVLVVALIVFSGELTSNLAAVVAMLPILFEIALGMKIDPLLLCVPAVVAASCGFMLPVATPPNAIVFGSGDIRLGQMVRAGFLLDLAAVVLIPLYVYLFGAAILGIKM